MEIIVEINENANLRIHKVKGKLTYDGLYRSLQNLFDNPDFHPDIDNLWDLSEAHLLTFTVSEIRQIADFVSHYWGKETKTRTALLVARYVDFGLSRLFEKQLTGLGSGEIMVFRDMKVALDWLGIE